MPRGRKKKIAYGTAAVNAALHKGNVGGVLMDAAFICKPGLSMELSEIYINVSGIEDDSIVDGPGLRMTLFTQGCIKNCPGCHNPQTHSLNGGSKKSVAEILAQYSLNPLLSGMTFSGGEPFLQAFSLSCLADAIHSLGGNIITYSGYYYEELRSKAAQDADIKSLLEKTDILIDGPFIEALKDLELLFRGSSNQRILDRQARRELDLEIISGKS